MVSVIEFGGFGFGFRHATDDEFIAINNQLCSIHNYADHSASIKGLCNIEKYFFST